MKPPIRSMKQWRLMNESITGDIATAERLVMSSSASYAAPAGDGRETRLRRALFSWPVGANSFWVAHIVAWLFIAVFGFASRLAAFDSVGLALALTAVLAMAGLVLVYSVLGGLLQMLLAGWVNTRLLVIPTRGVEDPSIR